MGATCHSRWQADERKTVFKNAAPKSPTKYANPLINFQGVVWGRHEAVATLISESGLYKLIMRSDKPDAVVFQNWLTKEVLPSIRKTGGYLLNEAARTTAHADTKEAMPDTPAFLSSRRKRPLLPILGERTVFGPIRWLGSCRRKCKLSVAACRYCSPSEKEPFFGPPETTPIGG